MHKKNWKIALMLAVLALVAVAAFADDAKKGDAQQGMPPMGPPEEMKQLAGLVGKWDCVMKMHMSMDPKDTTWMESKGTAEYKYGLGGAILETSFESSMMGQPFIGGGWESYDRESKNWQMTWSDNMSGRINLFTGMWTKDSASFSGPDKMMGQSLMTRVSTRNQKVDSFDWMGESSTDGGKTWMVWATAKYTRHKG